MIKYILLLTIFFSCSLSFSKIKTDFRNSNFDLCLKVNKNKKNKKSQCLCEKNNFTWLLNDKDKNIFAKAYMGEESTSHGKDNELKPIEHLVLEVILSCRKNKKYLAPKAKKLMHPKEL